MLQYKINTLKVRRRRVRDLHPSTQIMGIENPLPILFEDTSEIPASTSFSHTATIHSPHSSTHKTIPAPSHDVLDESWDDSDGEDVVFDSAVESYYNPPALPANLPTRPIEGLPEPCPVFVSEIHF